MVTFDQAKAAVEELINEADPLWVDKPPMVVTSALDARFGWLFYYTSSRYLETRDIRDAIAGNGPIYVVSETGDRKVFESAFIDEQIDAFENALADALGAKAANSLFRLFDSVRIKQLLRSPDSYDDWKINRRRPCVGDKAAITEILKAADLPDWFVVECVDEKGIPIWLGEFSAEEIEPVDG